MLRFLAVRSVTLMLGLLIASLIIFASLRILSGDVAQVIGGTTASVEQVAAIRERLGLDQPLPVQYVAWLGGIFNGNLGTSLVSGAPVAGELTQKALVTLPLTGYSLLIALMISFPLGIFAAYRTHTLFSRTLSVLGVVAAAVPTVCAGLIAILVCSTWLGWFPAQGFPRAGWGDPLAAIRSLTLPAATIGMIEGAILFRFVKSATLNALDSDHVLAGMSRGRTRLNALLCHGLPGVGLSIVSVLGLQFAGLLTGAIVVEQLFSLPGIGRMLVSDVGNRDLIKVQSTLLVLTAAILVLGALVDLVHRSIDPRLKAPAA